MHFVIRFCTIKIFCNCKLLSAKIICIIFRLGMHRIKFDCFNNMCISTVLYFETNLHGMLNKPENVMLSLLLNNDVFKYMAQFYVTLDGHKCLNDSADSFAPFEHITVKDFVTCFS